MKLPVTCIQLEPKRLVVIVVDPILEATIWSKVITFEAEILNNSGVLINEIEIALLLKKMVQEDNLPPRAKVLVNLRFLDLKTLSFPTLPPEELKQVVHDEVIHESIFSFSGETIASSFLILDQPEREPTNGVKKISTLAATIPKNAVTSIIAAFNDTGLNLESIQPGIMGMRELKYRYLPDIDQPQALLLITPLETELVIWQKNLPLFWRYLSCGDLEPERLQKEITTSLDHFKRRLANDNQLAEVYIFGKNPNLKFATELAVQGIPLEYPGLLGLGLQEKEEFNLSFYQAPPQFDINKEFADSKIALPLIFITILLVNIWLSQRLHANIGENKRLAQLLSNQTRILQQKKNQLFLLKESGEKATLLTNPQALDNKILGFLSDLWATTPAQMRLESLQMQWGRKEIQLVGFTENMETFNLFLESLMHLKHVHGISNIETKKQIISGGIIYRFQLSFLLGEIEHG